MLETLRVKTECAKETFKMSMLEIKKSRDEIYQKVLESELYVPVEEFVDYYIQRNITESHPEDLVRFPLTISGDKVAIFFEKEDGSRDFIYDRYIEIFFENKGYIKHIGDPGKPFILYREEMNKYEVLNPAGGKSKYIKILGLF